MDVDLDWGLEIAIINSMITNILIIFNKGLSLVKGEFLAFKNDKEECVSEAWVYLPNLYQKNNIAGIIIKIKRYSGFAKYKSLNITILLLYQSFLKS